MTSKISNLDCTGYIPTFGYAGLTVVPPKEVQLYITTGLWVINGARIMMSGTSPCLELGLTLGDYLLWFYYPYQAFPRIFDIQKYVFIAQVIGSTLAGLLDFNSCLVSLNDNSFWDTSRNSLG